MAFIGGRRAMRREVLSWIDFQGKAVGKAGHWQTRREVHARWTREIPYSSLVPIGIGRRDKEVAGWVAWDANAVGQSESSNWTASISSVGPDGAAHP